MTKVFQRLSQQFGDLNWGNGPITAGEANIEQGLMVVLGSTGRTVTLAAASGSRADGVAFGHRSQVQFPTTQVFDNGEELNVLMGSFVAAVSADFFASGSLPTETDYRILYQGASGKLALGGTIAVAKLIDIVPWNKATGGTGTTENVAIVRYNFDAIAAGG